MNIQPRQGGKRVGRGRRGPSRASGTQAVTRQGEEKVGKGIYRDPERSQRQTECGFNHPCSPLVEQGACEQYVIPLARAGGRHRVCGLATGSSSEILLGSGGTHL